MPLRSGVTLKVACADDRPVAEILGNEIHQFLLAKMHGDGALVGYKAPGRAGRDVGIERHRDRLFGDLGGLAATRSVVPAKPVAAQNMRIASANRRPERT